MRRTLVHAAQESDASACSAGGEGQQDSVRATQGPIIQEKTSAVCGSSDVSPCGGEKNETKV